MLKSGLPQGSRRLPSPGWQTGPLSLLLPKLIAPRARGAAARAVRRRYGGPPGAALPGAHRAASGVVSRRAASKGAIPSGPLAVVHCSTLVLCFPALSTFQKAQHDLTFCHSTPIAMAATLMDERALVLLRRKLETLSYTERLDAASAPLVARLVEDLVRATDSYRTVKLQAGQYAQEISNFNAKVRAAAAVSGGVSSGRGGVQRRRAPRPLSPAGPRAPRVEARAMSRRQLGCRRAPSPPQPQLDVVKRDCGRLAAENGALHAQLIAAGERADALRREGYAAAKHLEDRVAELTYWKAQAVGRCAGCPGRVKGAPERGTAVWVPGASPAPRTEISGDAVGRLGACSGWCSQTGGGARRAVMQSIGCRHAGSAQQEQTPHAMQTKHTPQSRRARARERGPQAPRGGAAEGGGAAAAGGRGAPRRRPQDRPAKGDRCGGGVGGARGGRLHRLRAAGQSPIC